MPDLPRRFVRGDRVVCMIGGELGWVPGAIQSVDETDPSEPDATLPYIVKLDAPIGKLISVPYDRNEVCRAEICFDEARDGGTDMALTCLPKRGKGGAAAKRRFAVDARVAVAVEDETDAFTDWAAGVVVAVDHAVDAEAPPVPYRVRLDAGRVVLVQRDEHWLIRDLAFQKPGTRQGFNGRRFLDKFVKREVAEGKWEMVDHATLKVRACAPPGDDA